MSYSYRRTIVQHLKRSLLLVVAPLALTLSSAGSSVAAPPGTDLAHTQIVGTAAEGAAPELARASQQLVAYGFTPQETALLLLTMNETELHQIADTGSLAEREDNGALLLALLIGLLLVGIGRELIDRTWQRTRANGRARPATKDRRRSTRKRTDSAPPTRPDEPARPRGGAGSRDPQTSGRAGGKESAPKKPTPRGWYGL